MPVAVVALAAYSFAGAAAAATAVGATMATMVAAGAVMAGSALTIVGTVTGNQKLTKIGAIVGIVGGLGSMAASAMSGADAAAAGASDAAAGGASDAASSTAASAAGDAAVQTVPVAAPGPIDAISGADAAGSTAAGGAAAGGAVPAIAPGAPAAGTGMLDSGASTAAAQAVGGNGNDLLAQSLSDPSAPFTPKIATGTPANAFDAGGTQVAQSGQSVDMTGFRTANPFSTPAAGQTGGGMLDSISPYNSQISAAAAADTTAAGGIGATVDQVSAWAKQNPELAKAALNATGAIAQNLVPSAKDRAMMQAYQQQAQLTAAQTATLNRRALWGSGRIS